jgi:hypothetical protein
VAGFLKRCRVVIDIVAMAGIAAAALKHTRGAEGVARPTAAGRRRSDASQSLFRKE